MSTGGENKNPNSMANLKPFGTAGGNPRSQDIKGSNKPWSVRQAIRHLAAQPLDDSDPKALAKLLGANATPAQRTAARIIQNAMNGNMRSTECMIEQIDGKVAQTNINADFAAIQGMSDDELEQFIAGSLDEFARSKDISGTAGTSTSQGSSGDADRKDESPGQAGDPAGL